ncbi:MULTISPECIES: hypothetical protein [unclassified Luteibacter]
MPTKRTHNDASPEILAVDGARFLARLNVTLLCVCITAVILVALGVFSR